MSTAAAPRIDRRLLRIIERHVDESPAEVTRIIGETAEALGLVRPSYEQVRVLLRRAEFERDRVTTMRARPAYDLPNRWYGDPLPWRPGAKNERRS